MESVVDLTVPLLVEIEEGKMEIKRRKKNFIFLNPIRQDNKMVQVPVGNPWSGEPHNCGRCRPASVSRGGPWQAYW